MRSKMWGWLSIYEYLHRIFRRYFFLFNGCSRSRQIKICLLRSVLKTSWRISMRPTTIRSEIEKKSIIKLISGPNQLISKQNQLISEQNQLIWEQNKLISELIIGTEERGKIRPDFKFYNCYRHTSAQSTCLSQVIVFSFTLLFHTITILSKNPFPPHYIDLCKHILIIASLKVRKTADG